MLIPSVKRLARAGEMAGDTRPGLDARRLIRLMREGIERCRLDLSGLTVLTEAATGAYVVTPLLAAMAGANVYALAGGTAYASAEEIRHLTVALARSEQIADRLHFICGKDARTLGEADIVTNSGQVRPIDAQTIALMKPSSVVPLMYESWEYRSTDVDVEACRARGIVVAGTNERHPDVDVFSFLGQMAVMQLHDAGIAVRGSRILILCDNDFGPFIVADLENLDAEVSQARELTGEALSRDLDAVIVAVQPREAPVFTARDAHSLSTKAPGAVLIQYWGDVDREACADEGIPLWPPSPPRAGHMGVLPSAVGPEPIVRLQTGGLKVGEVLARGLENASPRDRALVQLL